MSPVDVWSALDTLLAGAGPAERAGYVVQLAARLATLGAGLTTGHDEPTPAAAPDRLITPDEAAALAGLPMGTEAERERSRKRIYSWARGKRWASRPSTRCLRIFEGAFRRWLQSKG